VLATSTSEMCFFPSASTTSAVASTRVDRRWRFVACVGEMRQVCVQVWRQTDPLGQSTTRVVLSTSTSEVCFFASAASSDRQVLTGVVALSPVWVRYACVCVCVATDRPIRPIDYARVLATSTSVVCFFASADLLGCGIDRR